jgi:hypothetical protein
MRITLLAAVAAISLGTIGITGATAAPVSGAAINETASASSVTQQVQWHHHWWHHRHWRHGRWWYY